MTTYSPGVDLTYSELFGTGLRTYSNYGETAIAPPPVVGSGESLWTLSDPTNGDVMGLLIGASDAPGYYGLDKNILQQGMDLLPDGNGNFISQPTFVEGGGPPKPVKFSGKALNASEHLVLIHFYDKDHPVILTDDLGFPWQIYIMDLTTQRVLSGHEQWYFEWTISAIEV